jgi:hypothetical protein
MPDRAELLERLMAEHRTKAAEAFNKLPAKVRDDLTENADYLAA